MPESSHSLSLAEATAQMTAPGQLFEMENVEIAGIDTRVWKLAPPTMRAILDNSALFGDRDFIVYEDERISYARHHTLAATAAGRLRELGVKKGDRVAIAMRNLPEWIIGFWGAIALGVVDHRRACLWTRGLGLNGVPSRYRTAGQTSPRVEFSHHPQHDHRGLRGSWRGH